MAERKFTAGIRPLPFDFSYHTDRKDRRDKRITITLELILRWGLFGLVAFGTGMLLSRCAL